MIGITSRPPTSAFVAIAFSAALLLLPTGCQHPAKETAASCPKCAINAATTTQTPAVEIATTNTTKLAKRYTYTPKPYPVDERGFSPVDKALAKAFAREETIQDDQEGALNPYVL